MPIEGPVIASATDIEEAALIVGYEEASRRTAALIKVKAQSGAAAFAALEAEFDRRHSDAIRRRHAGDDSYWQERARRYATKAGWNLPEGGDGFRSFVKALSVTGTDLFGRARAMIAGADDGYISAVAREGEWDRSRLHNDIYRASQRGRWTSDDVPFSDFRAAYQPVDLDERLVQTVGQPLGSFDECGCRKSNAFGDR